MLPRMWRWTLAAVVVAMAGCQTAPVPVPEPAPPVKPTSEPVVPISTKASIALEYKRMSELFRGTPVVFTLLRDGSLRIDVPMKYSFEVGHAVVKPALASVLERMAQDQRELNTRVRVGAPADPDGFAPQLAKFRAISVRDFLMARGVGFTRFAPPVTSSKSDMVEILVSDAGTTNPTGASGATKAAAPPAAR